MARKSSFNYKKVNRAIKKIAKSSSKSSKRSSRNISSKTVSGLNNINTEPVNSGCLLPLILFVMIPILLTII